MAKTYTAAQKKAYAKRMAASRKKKGNKKRYNYGNRKALAKALQPIAEGRQISFAGADLLPLNSEWHVTIPNSWEMLAREGALETQPEQLTSRGFTGNTLFSRYINQHFQINFEKIAHIATPVQMRVLYGWAKLPYSTQFQAVGSTAVNAQGVLTSYNPEDFISLTLENQFSGHLPVNDPKKFKLMYNKEHYVKGLTIAGLTDKLGTPTLNTSCMRRELNFHPQWKPQRKYHMMSATKVTGSAAEDPKPDDYFPTGMDAQAFWTPSNTKQELWYPFLAVRFENWDSFGYNALGSTDANAFPEYVQKNTHYFYDL